MHNKKLDIMAQLVEYVSKLPEEDREKIVVYASAYVDGKDAGLKAASGSH